MGRSRALDLSAFDWAEVPRHRLPLEAARTLRYMQDIESHTIIYLRALLATRAIDDPEVSTFLACWLYEETFHGIALARFLEAAGHPVGPRPTPRGQEPLSKRLEARVTAMLSRRVAGLLRGAHDLGRHQRADDAHRLPAAGDGSRAIRCSPSCSSASCSTSRGTSSSTTARPRSGCSGPAPPASARLLVDRFWAPVGSGVQPRAELCFMATISSPAKRAAPPRARWTTRSGACPASPRCKLLEAWMDRYAGSTPGLNGGRNGHRHH